MAAATRTTIGQFEVWFSAEHGGLRMAPLATGIETEFEVECFTRDELATAHSVYMAAQQ